MIKYKQIIRRIKLCARIDDRLCINVGTEGDILVLL